VIVDSSALAAIVFEEPGWQRLVSAAFDAESRSVSAATWLEVAIVVDARKDPVLSRRLDQLLDVLGIAIRDVTASQAALARRAFSDFGKGRHPAGLNFGACFSYALASTECEPLLCTGDDFRKTDVEIVELPDGGH